MVNYLWVTNIVVVVVVVVVAAAVVISILNIHAVAILSLSLFVQEAWSSKRCFGYGGEKNSASPENWNPRPIFLSPTLNQFIDKYPTSHANDNNGDDGDDAEYDSGNSD